MKPILRSGALGSSEQTWEHMAKARSQVWRSKIRYFTSPTKTKAGCGRCLLSSPGRGLKAAWRRGPRPRRCQLHVSIVAHLR